MLIPPPPSFARAFGVGPVAAAPVHAGRMASQTPRPTRLARFVAVPLSVARISRRRRRRLSSDELGLDAVRHRMFCHWQKLDMVCSARRQAQGREWGWLVRMSAEGFGLNDVGDATVRRTVGDRGVRVGVMRAVADCRGWCKSTTACGSREYALQRHQDA